MGAGLWIGRLAMTGLMGLSVSLTVVRAQDVLRIRPKQQVLVGGETCTFDAGAPGVWHWQVLEPDGGVVDPNTGRYQAPPVERATRFHLRATRATDPPVRGETFVTVLPRGCFERQGTQGPEALPFLLPGTHRRFGQEGLVQDWFPDHLAPIPRLIAGYGIPVTVHWEHVDGTERELLSYREGDQTRCQEVTGLSSATFTFQGRVSGCTLEALWHGNGWRALLRSVCIGIRGMVPFAGDPAAEPGSGDGPSEVARFRTPVGLAVLGGGLHCPTRFVVADPGSHMLRALSRDGEAEGGWGLEGERGCRDGGAEEARFDQPAFVAVNRWFEDGAPCQYSHAFVVSDSGNHLIRKVDDQGRVATLAGLPGQRGFRDADEPRQALFDDPQGLVMDRNGNVFVADRGNKVIRRLARGGPVTTLAGAPGESGAQDGQGAQARFTRLGGLTQGSDGNLYVVDGHALRQVTLEGRVTTVLGVVERPGFRDDWASGQANLGGVPCLNNPSGVCAGWQRLFIADQGNHAVRDFEFATGTLRTLAGDPGAPRIRGGLLRDGLDGPLDPAYATLAAPRALAVCECGDLYVSTGTRLMRICQQGLPPPAVPRLNLEQPSVAAGEPLQVNFWVPTLGTGEASQPLKFRVDFINPDGTLAERQEGSGFGDRWLGCRGVLTKPGSAMVQLRCVTDQGVTFGVRKTVPVQ